MQIKESQGSLLRSSFEEMISFSNVLRPIFIVAITSILLISINVLQGEVKESAISVFILLAVTLILYGVYLKGYYKVAGTGLFLAISTVITYNLSIGGGIHDNAMVIFPVLITFTGLMFGKRIVPVITAVILAEISVIYWLTTTGVISPFDGRIEVGVQDFITVVILLLVSGILIWLTIQIIEKNFLQIIESENRLRKSYDHTIDGWGRALELFDKDTEGHSGRVTELTLKLARTLDIDVEDIEHIRRGAYLHDIGKMGVPDAILNKPGALTEEERQIVQMHPDYAYQLLKDIPFLVKALAIPYCHHERWDGTGYPRKLKGEAIPLPARIFAIVDNWDALLSDRPYRDAWEREKVVDYIKENSGRMFDPQLVEVFLGIVNDRV